MVDSERSDYGKTKRANYRVVVPRGVTDQALIKIFKEIELKGIDDVTIWCYYEREEINSYMPYTAAMLEKTKSTGIRITRR